jgi:nucleotide-binding universal stress UspA family protein
VIKNILIPTDGSPIASKAVNAGVQLAKQLGAAVTGYCAFETATAGADFEGYGIGSADADGAAAISARDTGENSVAEIAKAAADAGVPFAAVVDEATAPDDGIIRAALAHQCDLIVMASHGRSGLAGLVLGSVTNKVLSHSTIPVQVIR